MMITAEYFNALDCTSMGPYFGSNLLPEVSSVLMITGGVGLLLSLTPGGGPPLVMLCRTLLAFKISSHFPFKKISNTWKIKDLYIKKLKSGGYKV